MVPLAMRCTLVLFVPVWAACVGKDPPPTSLVQTDASTDAGTDSDAEPARPCARRSGTFVTTFTERYGTCGPYRNVTGKDYSEESYAEQPDKPPAPCSGVIRAASDNCSTTVETSCPSSQQGVAFETKGVLHWNEDGTSASGDLEVSLTTCKSTYHVEVSRR